MNANSGNEASAPAKPNTCSNTSWQTPRVAMNESTTVSKRMPAAKMLRSNKPRMIPIINNTIGMINRLSWRDAKSVSYWTAVPPSDLFFVEKEFINILKPKYNWDKTGDHLIVPTPSNTPPKKESLMIVETMRNA